MGVLAESADRDPATLPDLGHHERQVEKAIDGVIADQQRAVRRQVLYAVQLRLHDAAERLER